MPNYRRVRVPGGTYVFTVNLLERRRTLLVDHIETLRESFRVAHTARPFTLLAWVALPDHLHCVRRLCTRRQAKPERGIWQRRYWERFVRDEDHLRRCIDYVHINPQKHGYVERIADWPHSSFHRHVKTGLLPADWAGEVRKAG